MAVDPLTAKILAKVAVQAATDSESRKRILFMILAPVLGLLLLIAFILYLITSPFSVLSQWLIGDEVNVVEDFQKQYGYNQQLGIYEKDYIDGSGQSYEGIIFTDGVTEVVYYNQLDERWADLPYGTDNIGGYGCASGSSLRTRSFLRIRAFCQPEPFASDRHYFQLGRAAKKALSMYYAKPPFPRT